MSENIEKLRKGLTIMNHAIGQMIDEGLGHSLIYITLVMTMRLVEKELGYKTKARNLILKAVDNLIDEKIAKKER